MALTAKEKAELDAERNELETLVYQNTGRKL
jgi:hypothetical protein